MNALFGHAFEEIIWGHIGFIQELLKDYLQDCKLETVQNITYFTHASSSDGLYRKPWHIIYFN